MSSVAVFVFLLDNLPGFNNAINESLIRSATYIQSDITPIIQNCNPLITDQILSAVSQDLDLQIVPTFRTHGIQLNSEESSENVYNTNLLLDNSLHEAENAEDESFYSEFGPFYTENHNNIKQVEGKVKQAKNATKTEFPKSAPFLVAIFETLSNITAQTCAGTLLSPRWVLTAANCINILSNFYTNNTNITESSRYTVVVGSTNPLLDGSAHNVTSVLLHPVANSSHTQNSIEEDGPYLAMMKIEPEVEGPVVEMMSEEAESGDVAVYGWILSQNESDHDTLNRTSMSALILNAAECQSMYSYKNNDVMCLLNNDTDKNITQLSSGGPVLIVNDEHLKMLAVVQTDEHLFVAYPIAGHFSWISHVINST